MRFSRLTMIFWAVTTAFALSGQGSELPENMVLITGGSFQMGSDQHAMAAPSHSVTVEPFYMDVHEVTNSQYQAFCEATGHKLPEFWGIDRFKSGPKYPDHPVIGVSQHDATTYATWAGKRLPTEAEWEFAARAGRDQITYYFGDEADRNYARYNDPEAEPGPVKVGSYPPNGFGLHDMAGNAWEWVSDWYGEHYYEVSPKENPTGPASGAFKVFRGGGWHSGGSCISVHRRNALPQYWVDIAGGFRCVRDVSEPGT